jgi:hypothetical protein
VGKDSVGLAIKQASPRLSELTFWTKGKFDKVI